MIAAGFFSESLALDISVLVGLATIIGILISIKAEQRASKAEREEEVEKAVAAAITRQPDKVLVSPQPFLVEMKKEFVRHEVVEKLEERILALENNRVVDMLRISEQIALLPHQLIELLYKTGVIKR